jgi:Domain of unknown function (DUF4278)
MHLSCCQRRWGGHDINGTLLMHVSNDISNGSLSERLPFGKLQSPGLVRRWDEALPRAETVLYRKIQSEDNNMKLIYRGVKYEATVPTVTTTEGKVIGKYRGVAIHEHIVAH